MALNVPAPDPMLLAEGFEFDMSCEIVDMVITEYPVLIPLWKQFGVDVEHDREWCARHQTDNCDSAIRICQQIQNEHPEAFQDVLEAASEPVLFNMGRETFALIAYGRSVAGAAEVAFRFLLHRENDIRQWPRVLREQQQAAMANPDQDPLSIDQKVLYVTTKFFEDHADFYEIIRTGTPDGNGYAVPEYDYYFDESDSAKMFAMQRMFRAWPECAWAVVETDDHYNVGWVTLNNLWDENGQPIPNALGWIDDPGELDPVLQNQMHPCYLSDFPQLDGDRAFRLITSARRAAAFFDSWQHSLHELHRLPGPDEFSVTSLIKSEVVAFLRAYPSFTIGFLPLRHDLGFSCDDLGTLFCWGYWLYTYNGPSGDPTRIRLDNELVLMFQVSVRLCV